MGAMVRKVGAGTPTHLIEFIRFTIYTYGCVTKIKTGSVRNVRIYVLSRTTSAGDHGACWLSP